MSARLPPPRQIDWRRAPSVSVVVPAHNEEETLPHCLEHVAEVLGGMGIDYEVIVVDDASRDATYDVAQRAAAADPRVRVLRHETNRTLGGTLRSGFQAARKDLVLYVDADLPFDLSHVERALRAMRLTGADMIAGYRLDRTGEGLRRTLYSLGWNALVAVAFDLPHRDKNFSFKLFRRSLLDEIQLLSEGSFIDAELLVRARNAGANIQQIGVDYFPRTRGVSSLSSGRVIVRMLGELVRAYPELRAGVRNRRSAPRISATDGERVPATPRLRLIVNADDLGLAAGINRGIEEAHRDGIVTAASLVACGRAFGDALEVAARNPGLDLGLHLAAVGGERPVLPAQEIPTLVGSDGLLLGSWIHFMGRWTRGKIKLAEVEAEWRAQIERALAAGVSPSHFDTHQHLHALPALAALVARLARECGVRWMRRPREDGGMTGIGPLRRIAIVALGALASGPPPQGVRVADRTLGVAHAGRLDGWRLRRMLARAGEGVAELVCHPGSGDAEIAATYRWGYRWDAERLALCAPQLSTVLRAEGIALATFRELP